MHHTTTPKPTITIGELLTKKETTNHLYITSCAVILEEKMIFLGNNYSECKERMVVWHLDKYHETFSNIKLGFIATDGKFYDPEEAGMIAYRNRQTATLCSPLKPEDIF